ncbi:MAG: hypothetical protein ACXW3L_09800 [Limisphaerales bacterium]
MRERGVIDWVGVGGSGGHMSPEYFDYLPFPRFPDEVQQKISKYYYSPAPAPKDKPTLKKFRDWYAERNRTLGIWDLDREMKELQTILLNVQEAIIEGRKVDLPFVT